MPTKLVVITLAVASVCGAQNLLTSPSDITNAAWHKTDSSASGATTWVTAASGNPMLHQTSIAVSANTNYTFEVMASASPSSSSGLTVEIFGDDWGTALSYHVYNLNGTPQACSQTFSSGSYTSLIVVITTWDYSQTNTLTGLTLHPLALPASTMNQWSMGYYNSYYPGYGFNLPVSAIQWNGLTHVIQVGTLVNADGTLDLTTLEFSTSAAALVAAAHSHQVMAIVDLKADSEANWNTAIGSHLSTLVSSIMTVVNNYNFDGVDLNWEPFTVATSGVHMTAFSAALRTALGTKVLTVAAPAQTQGYAYWGANHGSFDRVNLMTYDMNGSDWDGYPWFNSPIYGNSVYSVESFAGHFLAQGLPATKLGIGIPFYGIRWTGGILDSDNNQGISGPRQMWKSGNAPTQQPLYYNSLISLITTQEYHWDTVALVPYLSHVGTTPNTYWYLTYDDPQSIQAKIQYIIAQGFGGWMIWELGADYTAGTLKPHPLLSAIYDKPPLLKSGMGLR